MNILKLSRNLALTLGVIVGAISSAQAVPILTFGQVGQANVVTGTRTGATTSLDATNAVITVSQIDAPNAAPFNAFLTFDFDSTNAATAVGPFITQNFSGDFCITSLPNCGGVNYLSGDLIDVAFGANAALTLSASTPPSANVVFTSDVITTLGLDRGASFSFANVTPLLHITNGTIDSFTSSVSGTFSAVPEPETLALLMMGLVAVGLARRRPKPLD
jgi:PEP-CTERM motif